MYKVSGVAELLNCLVRKMKHIIFVFSALLIFSCEKERIVQLPEIDYTSITEVNDLLAAYIFYDEAPVPDNVDFNRKNLISTTNWLVNVDKRLTLSQSIPQIMLLQEKRRSAQMHKNENAKNYFTCNDTSRKTLGFIDFTEVVYHKESSGSYISTIPDLNDTKNIKSLSFNLDNTVTIIDSSRDPYISVFTKRELINDLKKMDTINYTILLNFDKNLSFQDYVTYKSMLLKSNFENLKISNQEFLRN